MDKEPETITASEEDSLAEGQLAPVPSAPTSHFNWRLARAGKEIEVIKEYPLYTDAHIVGHLEEGCGPFQFLNTVPAGRKDRPTVILRLEYYLSAEHGKIGEEKDERSYHGGYIEDEIAALLSLSLGVRFKPGDANRIFDGPDDCRGRPISYETRFHRSDPVLPQVSRRGPLVPSALQKRKLSEVTRVCDLGVLSADSANALIRAARLYQEALWIVESEPHLSWLLFASAAETAANRWLDETEGPVEQLESWGPGPDLLSLLASAGGRELVEAAAEILAPYTGARQAFLKFLLEHEPGAPERRPPEHFQCSWTRAGLRKMFSKIYDYRSQALHGGTAFPAPMCFPPLPVIGDAHPEKPQPMQIGTIAAWEDKDLPMHIHIFEYIVRTALLKWWDELLDF